MDAHFVMTDGTVVPISVQRLPDANTYETEKRLYCPCSKVGGECFLKRSHHRADLSCDYAGGEHGA